MVLRHQRSLLCYGYLEKKHEKVIYIYIYIYILNRSRPRMDPWGTPIKRSKYDLYEQQVCNPNPCVVTGIYDP